MLFGLFSIFCCFLTFSSCAPKLDGKDHFDSKYASEVGIENLYVLPYIEVNNRPGVEQFLVPRKPGQIEAPWSEVQVKEDDARPYQLAGPFAQLIEGAERNFNIHRRTFYCNLVWSSLDTTTQTFTERYQIYYHTIHYATLKGSDCDSLSIQARQYCLNMAKEAFQASVSPMSKIALQNACEYFRTTIFPRERRRVYLVYKVDNCNKRVYKKLGDVCCWKCVGKGRHVLNPDCNGTPPEDCDVIQEQRRRARPEKLLID